MQTKGWPKAGLRQLHNLAGAHWREPLADGWLDVQNPATQEILARVPLSSAREVDIVVQEAVRAFPAWSRIPAPQRLQVLVRYKVLLEQHAQELAESITRENGKTLAEARAEIGRGIECLDFCLAIPSLLMGRALADVAHGVDVEVLRVPLGVVAGIVPFNFPMMVPMWMYPLAIACGNTVVMKASERVPLTLTRLAELFLEAGGPPGVLNLLHGSADTAMALIAHPHVRAVSFVGSERVARQVYEAAARAGKRVQALSGAKNHLVVMPDCAWEPTVGQILQAAFGSQGQRCMAASVVVAVGDIADRLVADLKDGADRIRVGDGREPDVDMGPVISQAAYDRIAGYVARGALGGAELVRDGRGEGPPGGYFLGPTVFDRVSVDSELWRDEIFGPVLAVVRVKDLDEALEVVNQSAYGNGASIFTQSGAHARAFRERVEAGMVGINVGVPAPVAYVPFAGWKASFFGDLHANGEDGVNFYTERRVITSRFY
ncbi:MAG: CoA-acylating methylmalonate-semialdehyde dehydrogenase [Firmicutes bacterium]|nr:CoA-acylating methylmalonate-semialdehyde dehydrogenase [Bacillota bacterium]